jgi:YegS/Rv2252/BmrU family lipid kinase
VFVSERAGHARELATMAAARGARLVIAWGGDGTINEVGCALARTDVALGIVPAGSGNGLAWQLGVSPRPERAIAEAIAATPRPMDVGDVDGRCFVNLAGIGFDAYVAAEFNRPGSTHRRGLVNYARIAARALRTYVPSRYAITTDTRRFEATAILVSIANSTQFGNGACIAPGACIDDGRLDLVVVEERSRWRTLAQIPRLFNGTIDRIAGVTMERIERATIECEAPMAFHVDGEPVAGDRTLRAAVHPGALRIAVKGTE